MSNEVERAREIDSALKAADAKKRADAEEAAMAGEKLDKILTHLDSLGRRMDAYEEERAEGSSEGEGEIEEKGKPRAPIRSAPTRKRSRIISARLAPLIRLRLTPFSPKFKPTRTGPQRHGARTPNIRGIVNQLLRIAAGQQKNINGILLHGKTLISTR